MTTTIVSKSDKVPQPSTKWRQVQLEEICRIVGGSTPDSQEKDYWNGDIIWVTPTDLGKRDEIFITNSARRITKAGYDSSGTEIVPPGSVVLSSRAPIGHLAIAGAPLCTNQGCKTFVPSPEVDSMFLYFLLKQSVPRLQVLGSGATFTEISKTQLKRFGVLIPPLQEQRHIAQILKERMEAVNKARSASAQQSSALKALISARLRTIFNSLEASQWPRKPFGEICDIVARQVDPKIAEYGSLPHVNGENIEQGVPRLLYLNTAAQEGMISGKYLFEAGDVLYSKLRPYLRKVVVVDFRGVCSADMYPIRVDRGLLEPHFAAWMLLSDDFTNYAERESRRARMPKLNREQLFAWPAPLPPLCRQREIVDVLDTCTLAVYRAGTALKEQLDSINKLPRALLRQALNVEA